jgi:homocysteine S-methyltransferase
MPDSSSFVARLVDGPPVLLDGPTGTELQRRGVETDVPGWSAAALVGAPQAVREIHRDYVAAGAEVLTANTFRTHPRNLAAFGADGRAAELTQLAVALARAAADEADRPVWIAGSQAPLGDCYEPDQTPDDAALEGEHRVMSRLLAAAGVDLILVETHPTLREALAATRAALSTGLPVVTSFVCNRRGELLSGESLGVAVRQAAALPVAAVAVNCILADEAVTAVQTLREHAGGRAVGVYCNVGYFTAGGWQNSDSTDPKIYGRHSADWLDAGATLIGSCCGTTPAHIQELRRLIDSSGCDG